MSSFSVALAPQQGSSRASGPPRADAASSGALPVDTAAIATAV
jgi:hypothetical protein